jgi:hypothetical protein
VVVRERRRRDLMFSDLRSWWSVSEERASKAYNICGDAGMNGLDGLLCYDRNFWHREQQAWRLEFC